MAIGASYYTELFTSTVQKIEKELIDQVLTNHPVLEVFSRYSSSITGRSVVTNIEGAELGKSNWTDDSGTFPTTVDADIMGAAEYDWSAPLVTPTRLRYKTLQMNSGEQALVDLVKAHVNAAKKDHRKKLALAMHHRAYNLGTTSYDVESGAPHSLDQLLGNSAYDAQPDGATATGAFTVGGITAADANHFWNAQRIENDVATGDDIRKAFRSVANTLATETTSEPRIIIAGLDVFEEYEDSFDSAIRYNSLGKGESRFRELYFDDMVVRLDPDCPPKRAYFLDPESLVFRILNGNFMKPMESQQIQGTLDHVMPIASILTVGVNQRRANAVLLRPATAGGDA